MLGVALLAMFSLSLGLLLLRLRLSALCFFSVQFSYEDETIV